MFCQELVVCRRPVLPEQSANGKQSSTDRTESRSWEGQHARDDVEQLLPEGKT